jgi:hypothetical protein
MEGEIFGVVVASGEDIRFYFEMEMEGNKGFSASPGV